MANAMSTAEDRRLKGSIASWFTTLRAMGTTNWHLTTSKVANYHWKPRQKRQGQIKISQKILVIVGRLFNIGLWIDKICHINWCSAVQGTQVSDVPLLTQVTHYFLVFIYLPKNVPGSFVSRIRHCPLQANLYKKHTATSKTEISDLRRHTQCQ